MMAKSTPNFLGAMPGDGPTPMFKKFQSFNRLPSATKAALKELLEAKKAELERKDLNVTASIKKSPIVQAMIEAALNEVDEARNQTLAEVKGQIMDEFEGDEKKYFASRVERDLAQDREQINMVASEMFRNTKQYLTELEMDWPNKVSLSGEGPKEVRDTLDAFILKGSGLIDHLTTQKSMLESFKIEGLTGELAAGAALNTAYLNSLIDATEEMAKAVAEVNKQISSVRPLIKNRTWYRGLKSNQRLIPWELIACAMEVNNNRKSILKAITTFNNPQRPPAQRSVYRKAKGGLGRFFDAVSIKAAWAEGDQQMAAMETQMARIKSLAAGTSKRILWNKPASEPQGIEIGEEKAKSKEEAKAASIRARYAKVAAKAEAKAAKAETKKAKADALAEVEAAKATAERKVREALAAPKAPDLDSLALLNELLSN